MQSIVAREYKLPLAFLIIIDPILNFFGKVIKDKALSGLLQKAPQSFNHTISQTRVVNSFWVILTAGVFFAHHFGKSLFGQPISVGERFEMLQLFLFSAHTEFLLFLFFLLKFFISTPLRGA